MKATERNKSLTISDLPELTNKGGMIELVPVSERYRFDINLIAVKRDGLYLGTSLLKLSRSVK